MAISVVDTAARYGGYADRKSVKFPEKPLLFVDDGIEVPRRDLEDNSNGNGVAETVFFSYSTLHQILGMHGSYRLSGDVPAGDYALNSRVISASLGRAGRHDADLAEPVTVELRHLREENVTGPVCVFWDYEVHAWSDRGCRLLETNVTHSKCACDHLTNFALLMRTDSNGAGINIRLDIVASVVAAVVVLGILAALVKVSCHFTFFFTNREISLILIVNCRCFLPLFFGAHLSQQYFPSCYKKVSFHSKFMLVTRKWFTRDLCLRKGLEMFYGCRWWYSSAIAICHKKYQHTNRTNANFHIYVSVPTSVFRMVLLLLPPQPQLPEVVRASAGRGPRRHCLLLLLLHRHVLQAQLGQQVPELLHGSFLTGKKHNPIFWPHFFRYIGL